MKKMHVLLRFALIGILFLSQMTYGQNQKVTREQWRTQIQQEEQVISNYVEERMAGSDHSLVLKKFHKTIERWNEIKIGDLPAQINQYVRNHYRDEYFQTHPNAAKIYNPGRVQLNSHRSASKTTADPATSVACTNGNFEDDITLSDYAGFTGPLYGSGECSFVPGVAVMYTPTAFSNPDAFLLTNNAPDPLVPALDQTNNASPHALRINASMPCTPANGVNMLQKLFTTPTAGTYSISFSYALVMEDPNHFNANPFFVARVLDGSGTEVGTRICRVADLSNPIYNVAAPVSLAGCRTTDSLVWRDWSCASIEFQGDPSQTFTIEFFMADCGGGAHFGYAYVDDICASQCCPDFTIRNCCELNGGARASNDAAVKKILADYDKKMDAKYNYSANGGPDPCCNPCKYPNDPFPVFIMDEFNALISSTDYTISWSHDPGNSSAFAFILPGQQTVVTVAGPGNCVWTDTFSLDCCDDTITITPFCHWDPCDYPNSPFPVRVLDQNGNTLTTGAGYTFSWIYGSGTSTGDAITATLADFPVIVTVTDTTGCTYTDTLDIICCKPNTPKNLKCTKVPNGSLISWDPVPGAYYKVIINKNDPSCCHTTQLPVGIMWTVYGTDTTVMNSVADCFSWQVIAVCPDGTESPVSDRLCSCTPVNKCKAPTDLKCSLNHGNSVLTWTPPSGAMGYEIQITWDDPACCHGNPPTMTWLGLAGPTYTVVPGSWKCFSWRVRAICRDGYSDWVDGGCGCQGHNKMGGTNNEDDNMPVATLRVEAVPNPASDYIDFNLHNMSDKNNSDLEIAIYDLTGRQVSRKSINENQGVRVDVRTLSPGIYTYKLTNQGQLLYSSKVVIQRN